MIRNTIICFISYYKYFKILIAGNFLRALIDNLNSTNNQKIKLSFKINEMSANSFALNDKYHHPAKAIIIPLSSFNFIITFIHPE